MTNKNLSEYQIWLSMKSRCSNPANKNYGARGIAVSDRWKNFNQFLADMGPRPRGFTLDRIDPNGNYSPENCRWASTTTQARNKRNTIWLEFEGQLLSLPDVADRVGVRIPILYHHIVLRKKTLSEALEDIARLERFRIEKYQKRRMEWAV